MVISKDDVTESRLTAAINEILEPRWGTSGRSSSRFELEANALLSVNAVARVAHCKKRICLANLRWFNPRRGYANLISLQSL